MMKRLLSFVLFALAPFFIFSQDEVPNEDLQFFKNPVAQYQNTNFWNAQDAPIQNSQWEWLHQTPQGNTIRWIKAFDENTWYAAGFSGTFMKTTDAGSTWQTYISVTGFGTTGLNYTIYDGHFFNQNTGLICGSGGNIYRTTDGGVTFDSVGAISSAVTWYDMYFVNDTLGYAAGTTSGRLAVTTDGGLTWTQNTTIPSGTYYSVFAVDADTILVGSTSGNIRRSTDGGSTWTTINVGASYTLYSLQFSNDNYGWVTGTSSNAFYTTNNGLTWNNASTGLTPSTTFYDIDFRSVSTPVFSLEEGFEDVTFPPTGWHAKNLLGTNQWIRSTSQKHTGLASAFVNYQGTGGEDWLVTPQVLINNGDSLVFWIRKNFSSAYPPDSLIIRVSTTDTVTSSFTNVLGSIDVANLPASTWLRYAYDLSSFSTQNVFVAFQHKDTDGNGVYLDDVSIGQVFYAESVVLTGDAFDLNVTTDMGASWTQYSFLDPSQSWTSTYYSLSYINDSTVVVGGGTGLINWVQGMTGRTCFTNWIKAGTLYDISAVIEPIEVPTSRIIAVGAPGIANSVYDQIMYSTNSGASWNLATYGPLNGATANSIKMLSNIVGFAAFDSGYVYKTTNGGSTWTGLTSAGAFNIEEIVPIDENVLYVYGASGNGAKSTDGGTSWSPLTSGHGTSTIYDAVFSDALTGITVGSSGKAYKTTDGGVTTFALTPNMSTSTIYTIDIVDANTMFLAGSSGKVRRTTDAGTTWDTVDVPTSTTLYSVDFVNSNFGYVVGSSGVTYSTTDAGETWNFDNNGASTLNSVFIYQSGSDSTVVYAAGSFAYILSNPLFLIPVELASFSASVNGSDVTLSWSTATEKNNFGFTVERKLLDGNWNEVGFVKGAGTTTETQNYTYTDKNLSAGTYNYRIKQIDFDGTFKYYNLNTVVDVESPTVFALEQNYPNPFNPTTIIKYAVPKEGLVNISVFNILGEKVLTLVDGIVKAGSYEVNFNASNLASGVYIYRMEAGNYVQTKKMMLMK